MFYQGALNGPTICGPISWIYPFLKLTRMFRPHDGFLTMAKPFIDAWKAGEDTPTITSDEITYWYRVAPRDINCDATDTTMQPANNASGNYFMGRPNGWETMTDSVFVVALLTAPGEIIVNSGGNEYIYNAPVGASAFEVPMGIGSQYFALQRSGSIVISATSLREIKNECPCGYSSIHCLCAILQDC